MDTDIQCSLAEFDLNPFVKYVTDLLRHAWDDHATIETQKD